MEVLWIQWEVIFMWLSHKIWCPNIRKSFHANDSYLMLLDVWSNRNILTHSHPDTQKSLLITARKSSNNIWTQRRFDGIKWKTIKCILFYGSSLRLPIILVLSFGQEISKPEAWKHVTQSLRYFYWFVLSDFDDKTRLIMNKLHQTTLRYTRN